MGKQAQWPPRVKKHKRGQAVIRVAGKDHWLGRHGSPEAEVAYRELVERLARERAVPGAPPPPVRPTVAEVVDRWAREALGGYSEGEQDGYRRALTVLVRVRGQVAADDFGPDDLEAVRDAMCDGSWMSPAEKRSRPAAGGRPPRVVVVGWSRGVVNRRVGRVKTAWRWLEKKRLVPRGSWAGLRSLARLEANARNVRNAPKRRTFSTGEIVAAALAMPRSRCRLMLLLQLWSGMRSGEVRNMRWDEIDTAGEDWVYRPATHKNAWRGQERAVVLGPRCRAVLCLARRRCGKGEGLAFPCKPGKPYTRQGYGLAVARAAGRVGLKGMRPYSSRHACKQRLTRLLGLDAARAMLGQKSLGTANSYGDSLDLATAVKAARKAG